jgi:DNA polymerase delta subunit 1
MGFLAPSTSTNFNRSKMKRADGAPGAATAAQKKPRNDDDEPDFDFEDFDEAEVDMYLAGSVDAAVSGFTVPEHSKQRWLRPSPPPIDSAVHDISMQQIEIDYYIGEGRQDLPGAQEGAAAILRIYGVTQDGNSCMVHVHQYEPYFFIQAPQGFTEADAPAFAEQLNQITDGQDKSKSKPARYIRRVELCQKQTLMGYTQDKVPFIKIVTTWPRYVTLSYANRIACLCPDCSAVMFPRARGF